MMKKKWGIIFAFVCAAVVSFVLAACAEKGTEFSLKETLYWLDRYEEKMVELESGDLEDLTWKSSDESVVTVEAGKLIAQGEGNATVTVSSGKHSENINVRVTDSGTKPMLQLDDFYAYEGVETPIPAAVSYNGATVAENISCTAVSGDESVAVFRNGLIYGAALGEAQVTVTAEYKGLTLTKVVSVTVREADMIDFEGTVSEIYAIKEGSNRTTEIEAAVIEQGKVVPDAVVRYTVAEGEEHVTLDGASVIAVSEGEAVIRASATVGTKTITGDLTITVHPNYVATAFNNTSLEGITWEKATGTIGGREAAGTDMMRYRAGEFVKKSDGTTDWSNTGFWEHRVSEANSGVSLIDLYRRGYRYFAYDLYYGSNANFYLGVDKMGPTSIPVGEVWGRDYVLAFTKEDGVINRIEKGEDRGWITIAFDLYALIERSATAAAGFFFTVDDNTTDSYVMNVRYYLDDAFLPADRLTYEEKDGYEQASEEEFIVKYPVSRGYRKMLVSGADKPETVIDPLQVPSYAAYNGEVGGRTGVYRYKTIIGDLSKNTLVVATSLNESLERGLTRLYGHGRYLTFDLYVEEGLEELQISVNDKMDTTNIKLGLTNLAAFDWLHMYKNGKLQYTLTAGEWYTVSIGFADAYTADASYANIELSVGSAGKILYIDDVRYRPDASFLPSEYEGEAPQYREPEGIGVKNSGASLEAIVNQSDPFYGTVKYTNTTGGATGSVWDCGIYFTDVVTLTGTPGPEYGMSLKYIKFEVYLDSGIKSFTIQSWFTSGGSGVQYYSGSVDIGSAPGSTESGQTFFVEAGEQQPTDAIKLKTWYTVYIPIIPTANADWGNLYFMTNGGTEDTPSVAYIKDTSIELLDYDPFTE